MCVHEKLMMVWKIKKDITTANEDAYKNIENYLLIYKF